MTNDIRLAFAHPEERSAASVDAAIAEVAAKLH